MSHEPGRNGICIDCMKSQLVERHSVCWGCGHDIDHTIGHDCYFNDPLPD